MELKARLRLMTRREDESCEEALERFKGAVQRVFPLEWIDVFCLRWLDRSIEADFLLYAQGLDDGWYVGWVNFELDDGEIVYSAWIARHAGVLHQAIDLIASEFGNTRTETRAYEPPRTLN